MDDGLLDFEQAKERERVRLFEEIETLSERIALLEETQKSSADINPRVQQECSQKLLVERERLEELRAQIAPLETGSVHVEGTARLQAYERARFYCAHFAHEGTPESAAKLEGNIGNRIGQARFDARATFARIAWNGPRERYQQRYLVAFTAAWHAHVASALGER